MRELIEWFVCETENLLKGLYLQLSLPIYDKVYCVRRSRNAFHIFVHLISSHWTSSSNFSAESFHQDGEYQYARDGAKKSFPERRFHSTDKLDKNTGTPYASHASHDA